MDILNQVIQLMNKEEVRHFKLFTGRTQVKGTRKDLLLFDYIRKVNDDYEEDRIFHKLYDKNNKNAFYRLKNRLLTDLNKSLVIQHLDDDDTNHIFHLLSLSRFFFNRNSYEVAYHYIRKAEKKAIALENYELLDFIYSELIKLSHEIISINPETYIQKRKQNRDQLLYLREIEDILAAAIYRLKITQNYSAKNPVIDLLQKTVEEYSLNDQIRKSPKLRFALYQSVSRILVANKDYVPLEQYILSTWETFSGEGLFNKRNHDTKLQMLTFIVNTLYKNGKDSEALKFTDLLKEAMAEYNGFLQKKYTFFYYNSLAHYYNKHDKEKAIKTFEEMKEQEGIKGTRYEAFSILNLSIVLFMTYKFRPALKSLIQLYLHDSFQTNDDSFKFKIATYELILRFEVDDFETIEKRIDQVRKDFAELIQLPENSRDRELISLLEAMVKSIDIRRDKALVERISNFLKDKPEDEQDIGVVDYYDWLKEKI